MAIEINRNELLKIQKHGKETYPEESCGVLIGTSSPSLRVIEARRVVNINLGSKKRRYNIDPIEYMDIEKELDGVNSEILGIYHTHPDHPSKPSEFDLNNALPNFSYIILSVNNGERGKLTSWRLNSTREEFCEEQITIRNDDS
jgi:proteasome lid subunit RPN8/RPN11